MTLPQLLEVRNLGGKHVCAESRPALVGVSLTVSGYRGSSSYAVAEFRRLI